MDASIVTTKMIILSILNPLQSQLQKNLNQLGTKVWNIQSNSKNSKEATWNAQRFEQIEFWN